MIAVDLGFGRGLGILEKEGRKKRVEIFFRMKGKQSAFVMFSIIFYLCFERSVFSVLTFLLFSQADVSSTIPSVKLFPTLSQLVYGSVF